MDSTLRFDNLSEKEIQLLREEEIAEQLENTKWLRYFKTIKRHWPVYVMLIPVIIFFFLFK